MKRWRLLWVIAVLLMIAVPTMAQDAVQGRTVTVEDWQARIPLLVVIIILVLIVDAFFLLPIFRKKSQQVGGDS
jgi:hypothetical protein